MRSSFNSSMESTLYRSSESNFGTGLLRADSTSGLSGIGLLMQQDDGAGSPVYIKSIVPGGSCDRDGVCKPGDFVIAVNNQKVSHIPVVDIREKIVGPMGTNVILLFQRPDGEYYERTLIRGTPAYFDDRDRGLPHGILNASNTGLLNPDYNRESVRERSSFMNNPPNPDNLMSRSIGSVQSRLTEQLRARDNAGRDEYSSFPATPSSITSAQPLRSSFRDIDGSVKYSSFRDVPSGSGMISNAELGRLPSNNPQFLSRSLDAQSIQQAQPDNLSRSFDQFRSVEGELAICKDELVKTKALLEQHKTDSTRYVKDIDTLQQKNAEQVMKLQALLNQSEQTRRELEIQVANGRSREDEFQIVLARAKEQTEAREQYFAELKRQFEESRVNWERDISREKILRAETERARDQARENVERIQRDINMLKESDRSKREKEEEIRKYLQEAETRLVTAKQLEAKIRNHFQSMRIQYDQWQTDFFSSKSKEETDLEQFFLLA